MNWRLIVFSILCMFIGGMLMWFSGYSPNWAWRPYYRVEIYTDDNVLISRTQYFRKISAIKMLLIIRGVSINLCVRASVIHRNGIVLFIS